MDKLKVCGTWNCELVPKACPILYYAIERVREEEGEGEGAGEGRYRKEGIKGRKEEGKGIRKSGKGKREEEKRTGGSPEL